MTSNPLFISVAESMDIFSPMDQVGCARACSLVTLLSRSLSHPRNGPPEPVITTDSDRPSTCGFDELKQGRVLGVDGQDARALLRSERSNQRAGTNHALLISQRDRTAMLQSHQGRLETSEPHDGVQHDIGLDFSKKLTRGADAPSDTQPIQARQSLRRHRVADSYILAATGFRLY